MFWVFGKAKNRPNLARQAFNNLTSPSQAHLAERPQAAAVSPALTTHNWV
jgi:hypothetical protein